MAAPQHTNAPLGAWKFITDDCKRARTCVCGFCKRDGHCDYGDCLHPATGRCPRFRYPVCDRHANVNVQATPIPKGHQQ